MKDTVLKADMMEILTTLKNDVKREKKYVKEALEKGDYQEGDEPHIRAQGWIAGMEFAITNFELNI